MSRKPIGLRDFIGAELVNATHDIRQKVFEEAFFGRVVTAAPVMEMRETPADKSHAVRLAELWDRVLEEKTYPDRKRELENLWSPDTPNDKAPEPQKPDRDEPDIER